MDCGINGKRLRQAARAICLCLAVLAFAACSLRETAGDTAPVARVTGGALGVEASAGGVIALKGEEALAALPKAAVLRKKSGSGGLPSSYVSETVTEVLSQGSTNLCWACAALDAGRMGLIKMTGSESVPAYSPGHLGYAAYHGEEESWGIASSASWHSIGGNGLIASSTLLRWYGAAGESRYPTGTALSLGAEELGSSLAHLTGFERLASPGSAGTDAERESAVRAIKEAVRENGAVAINLCFQRGTSYDEATNACYSANQPAINHQVVLIGWDDAKVTKAPTAGAFLAKNSYGTGFGDRGLFWVSYADTSLTNPYVFHFENSAGGQHGDTDLYSYDGIGYWVYMRKSGSSIQTANVFTAARDECIDAVGFYVPAGGNFRVELRTGLQGGDPMTGQAAVSVSGNRTYFGYYTIALPEAVTVEKGSDFAVVVTLAQNGTGWAYFEGSSRSEGALRRTTKAEAGQTYIRVGGGSFSDILSYVFELDGGGRVSGIEYGNACIKAYGNPVSGTPDGSGRDSARAGLALRKAADSSGKTESVVGALSGSTGDGASSDSSLAVEISLVPPTESDAADASAESGGGAAGQDAGKALTVYRGVDYAAVYDFAYYMKHYPALRKKYGSSPGQALKYFVTQGMAKMHRASAHFSVKSYVNEYASLRRKYGTDWKKYYLHYIRVGSKKGWHGRGCTRMKNPVTKYRGKSYRKEYNFFTYLARYPKLKRKYRYDDLGALACYVTRGRKLGQKAK